ncbi:MAG: cytochrome c3 family protein [Candidatus Rokubacteria bacterium]|nr:cytochrome c3 family protein [Candidatus Rokubacteria bacterium]
MVSVAVVLLAAVAGAPAAPAASEEVDTCLGCHGDRNLSMTLPSGERLALFVDAQTFRRSVHGDRLGCVECHAGMRQVPHPAKPFRTARDVTLAYYEQCKGCHFDNFTKTLDSVHYQRVAKGDARAPVCSDCHTAHAVAKKNGSRSRISQTCARCHQPVFAAYAKSVHGRALLEEGNRDVPVCTDCHRSHDIGDPRTSRFHLATPELCGSCHTDEQVMEKYGLSTKVVSTYLGDFHGVTASLQRSGTASGERIAAVCTDCHGIHDITRVREPGSAVMRENLVKVCQRCHADATANFPAAWLGHYEPSWSKAPIVYGVTIFYWIFIPFVIGGLVLQIVLHLWRVVVNR